MMLAGADKLEMTHAGNDQPFACRHGQSLLTAMIEAGRSSIKVGCRNGGCGVCRVQVTAGTYDGQKMTRSRISEADEAQGIVLACRILPRSNLSFEPLPLKPAGAGA